MRAMRRLIDVWKNPHVSVKPGVVDVRFHCPNCSHQWEEEPESGSQYVQCPECFQVSPAVLAQGGGKPAAQSRSSAPPKRPAPSKPSTAPQSRNSNHAMPRQKTGPKSQLGCPQCGNRWKTDEHLAEGDYTQCPECFAPLPAVLALREGSKDKSSSAPPKPAAPKSAEEKQIRAFSDSPKIPASAPKKSNIGLKPKPAGGGQYPYNQLQPRKSSRSIPNADSPPQDSASSVDRSLRSRKSEPSPPAQPAAQSSRIERQPIKSAPPKIEESSPQQNAEDLSPIEELPKDFQLIDIKAPDAPKETSVGQSRRSDLIALDEEIDLPKPLAEPYHLTPFDALEESPIVPNAHSNANNPRQEAINAAHVPQPEAADTQMRRRQASDGAQTIPQNINWPTALAQLDPRMTPVFSSDLEALNHPDSCSEEQKERLQNSLDQLHQIYLDHPHELLAAEAVTLAHLILNNPHAALNQIDVFQWENTDRLEDTQQLYRLFLQRCPKHAPALKGYGRLYIQLGNRERGVQYMERALSLEPSNDALTDELMIHYQKDLGLKPDPLTQFKIVKLQLKRNNIDQAIVTLQQLTENSDYRQKAGKLLGFCFWQKQMYYLAWQKFKNLPPTEEMMDILYRLAADMEAADQWINAQYALRWIERVDASYRDVKERLEQINERIRSQNNSSAPKSEAGA
ncbi:hypothetical protein JXA32_00590 [Candidatus Sumerlaeota bacterium]|nr:hypothetical protein [Candidatus Sumerlaeota bacterium]